MIVNPSNKRKEKWYRCGYIEGKYIAEHFGLSSIHVDDKFYYYVETEEFKQVVGKIPKYIKFCSNIKNMKQKVSILARNLRRKN